jgi:redox-sensitive bicupin YhaK (pirin superfamily)
MANTVIRRSSERGFMDYGAVQSKLSFSFGDYYDPKHMGFRVLRVINQDVVEAGAGFPTHGHKDMEIFSYVLEGTIAHRDSLGNNAELKPGQIQVMSAGSGVKHSEFNPSKSELLRFIQVWIEPKAKGLSPRYSEWKPTHEMQSAAKVLIISEDGREQSAKVYQDVSVYRLKLSTKEKIDHALMQGRGLWLQVISGAVNIGQDSLAAGDAWSTEQGGQWQIEASGESVEALLFDLA